MSREFSQNIVSSGKIIDFHTHPYRHRGEFMGMYGEHFYLEPEQMPSDLAEAGISVFCGSVIDSDHRGAMESFDRVREVNDAALQLREKFGSAYVPGFHVHPAFLKESLQEVERMHREGVKLVGELVPYLQGWQHTFVAAHPGQKADYLLHVERMKKFPNLNLDISGTGLFRYGLLAALAQTVGSDRVLFGTDYPICNPRMYVQAVLGEHISDEDKEKILFGNARRILGI